MLVPVSVIFRAKGFVRNAAKRHTIHDPYWVVAKAAKPAIDYAKVDRVADVLTRFGKAWLATHRRQTQLASYVIKGLWSEVDTEAPSGGLLPLLRIARAQEVIRANGKAFVFRYHLRNMLKLMRKRINDRPRQHPVGYRYRLTCTEAEWNALVSDLLADHKRRRIDIRPLVDWIREMRADRAAYLQQVKVWAEMTIKRQRANHNRFAAGFDSDSD